MVNIKIPVAITILTIFSAFLALTPAKALGEDSRVERLEKEVQRLKEENIKIKEDLKGVIHIENLEGEQITVHQKVLDELNKKSEEIKDTLELVESETDETRHNLVTGFVKISGYADVEFRVTDIEDDHSHFRVRHLSLFFSKEIEKKWRFFSEIEFEDSPLIVSKHSTDEADKVQGKILVEQVYIEFKPALGLEFRAGRFLTPAGIWSIYHYYPYVPTQTRPLLVRKVFPQVSDGLQARKAFSIAGSLLDTNLYVSNGSGNPGRLDRNENKAIGARINFSPNILDGIDIGLSYFGERDNSDTRKDSMGLHLKATYRGVTFQTEYATRKNNPELAGSFNDTGWYAQLSYDIGRWTAAGRFDWYDVNDSIKDADQYRYTGAINYHFSHNVVGKLEVNRNEFDDDTEEDCTEAIASIVIAIGDL